MTSGSGPICVACGTEYPSGPPRAACAVCDDERQFVPPEGQRWTSMEELALMSQQSSWDIVGVARAAANCAASSASRISGGPPLPREIKDISDYPEMTKALQRLGYSEERIRKILGLNLLRVIREVTEDK